MKKLRYLAEAALLYIIITIFRLMPVDHASAFGGRIAGAIGPRLPSSRTALNNMKRALPGRTEQDYNDILSSMWNNLGRVIAEYPHLKNIAQNRVTFTNSHILENLRDDDLPAVLFSGHLSNWEALPTSILLQHNLVMGSIYRKPNNPWVAQMLQKSRTMNDKTLAFSKSRHGMRQAMSAIKEGQHIGILIDQKYNEGILVDFFDMPAMTSAAFVQLAQKFNCPLVPCRIERRGGAHFHITCFDPLTLHDSNQKPLPTEDIIKASHTLLENWIKEKPEQWIWTHRRWPSQTTKTMIDQQEKNAA